MLFRSFCDRAGRGQFPQLSDRTDLWRLLLTLTIRKAVVTIRHQTRRKRGGGRVVGESAVFGGEQGDGLAAFFDREPSPEDVVIFTDDLEERLDHLKDATLKRIAVSKLEGYGIQEIAAELGASTRTVERKLRLIRAIWEEGAGMIERETVHGRPPLADLQQIDAVCDRFEMAWRTTAGRILQSSWRKFRQAHERNSFEIC